MPETRPVLIAGAGPTGLTAALELTRLRVPVRIIDKLPAPSNTSRALAIQARTLELLAPRGTGAELLQQGNRATGVHMYADGKTLGRVDLTRIPSRYNFILLLPQSETERILREHLAALHVTVEQQTELIAFQQMENTSSGTHGVKAILRKPDNSLEELDCAWMISAEGAHSIARRTLGLEFEGRSLVNLYALADVHLDGDVPEDELTICINSNGLLAVFPMGNRRFRLMATEATNQEQPNAPSLEHIQQLWDAAAPVAARLHTMAWSSHFRINSRMLHQLRHQSIFFGGDAAHIHSPVGAQGMNTGIQDMINLCWKLAAVYHGHATPALLDTYSPERISVIRHIVETTEAATDTAQSHNTLVHQLLLHIAPFALHHDFFQNTGTRLLSQIGANYRGSALAEGSPAHGELHAGDRAPDSEVAPNTWLHDLIHPGSLTLLAFDNQSPSDALDPWASLLVTDTLSQPAPPELGNATYALIRPDGYLTCLATSEEPVLEWLQRWFPR